MVVQDEDEDEDEDKEEEEEEEDDDDDERTIIMEVEDELSKEHVKEAKEEEPAFNIPDEDDKEDDASVLAAFAKHKQPAAAGRSKQAK